MTGEQFLEAIGIAQEEAAEVIQALSKIRRSGHDFKPFGGDVTNWQHAQNEVYDLLILLQIVGFDLNIPFDYRNAKIEKLRRWSTLID